MHTNRHARVRATALAATMTIAVLGPALNLPAGAAGPTLPQTGAARSAAAWLGDQFTPGGFIPGSSPDTPNLSSTANSLLALAAAGVDASTAENALTYLETHSADYIPAEGSDGPGQLSLLILDATALGADPTSFGGTNLVARLLATEQTTGPDAGLFGTETQLDAFDAGTFDQGLALSALKAAHVPADASARAWLVNQQCPDGGWALPDVATNTCTEDPATFAGPDTNSTSSAVEGLAAQGALTSTIEGGALTFLDGAQNTDGGWGYQPTNPSEPDSTSLVMQGLLAMGQVPTSNTVTTLLSFQIATGGDAGALTFPGGDPTTGNVIATYQSAPALAGLTFPLHPPPVPTVGGLSVHSGVVTGGTSVTISGQNLSDPLSVSFGTTAAPSYTVNSDTAITAISPAATGTGPVNVTVTTLGGSSATSGADRFTYEPTGGPYSPLTPVRICDTRAGNPSGLNGAAAQCNGSGNAGSTIGAGGTRIINVAGAFGVPADATGVVVNITVVNPTAAGYLTVFPQGAAQPFTANVNYTGGQVVPNLVEVGTGSTGAVSVFTKATTDIVVDLEGYVAPKAASGSPGSGSGLYNPLTSPARLCDTRAGNPSDLSGGDAQCNGTANAGERLGAGGTLSVQVATNNLIPAGATAAVLNVTAVTPSGAGFLTVYPQGAAQPVTANVNYTAGQTTGNRVIVPLSTNGATPGEITIFSKAAADVVVDVSGYFSAPGGSGTAFTASANPVRICDTRAGDPSGLSGSYNQCDAKTLGPAQTLTINVAGLAGVPANAKAVVVNLTGVSPSVGTFLTVFPGLRRPFVADLNLGAGEVKANLTVAALSPNGTVSIYNNTGSTNVVLDVLGWFS